MYRFIWFLLLHEKQNFVLLFNKNEEKGTVGSIKYPLTDSLNALGKVQPGVANNQLLMIWSSGRNSSRLFGSLLVWCIQRVLT